MVSVCHGKSHLMGEPKLECASFPRTLFALAPALKVAFRLIPRRDSLVAPVSMTGNSFMFTGYRVIAIQSENKNICDTLKAL